MILKILRILLAVIGGNVLGYAAFRAAAWVVPQLWYNAGDEVNFAWRVLLIAVSAILFAAPPVFVGAIAAKISGHHEIFVGLGASLWGISARGWWPASTLLPPESWLAPMTLIFISGLMGAWVMVAFQIPRSAP